MEVPCAFGKMCTTTDAGYISGMNWKQQLSRGNDTCRWQLLREKSGSPFPIQWCFLIGYAGRYSCYQLAIFCLYFSCQVWPYVQEAEGESGGWGTLPQGDQQPGWGRGWSDQPRLRLRRGRGVWNLPWLNRPKHHSIRHSSATIINRSWRTFLQHHRVRTDISHIAGTSLTLKIPR